MKQSTKKSYIERIDSVLAFLAQHPYAPLDLHRLAEEACLSPYHFHRIYVAIMGETVAETMRRLRLQRAGALLLTGDKEIAAIAEQAGYTSVQAFGRAFRQAYGVTPAAYRRQGGLGLDLENQLARTIEESDMYKVVIEEIDPVPVVAFPHEGDYRGIGYQMERLANWAIGKDLLGPEGGLYAVYYDDPTLTPRAQLRSDLCVLAHGPVDLEPPYRLGEIQGGRYAVVTFQGPFHETERVSNWLFGVWLPASGEEPDDRPCFTRHLGNPRVASPQELSTRIFLPIKE